MDRIIFSNKMGLMNIFYIVLALAFASVVVLAQDGGKNAAMLLAIMGCLLLFCLVLLWVMIKLIAGNTIAELIQSSSGLTAEMTHMFGRGKKILLPLPRPEDWSWEIKKTGKRGRQRVPILKLASGGRTYKLWLAGAKTFDREIFRQMAPRPMQEMAAAGLVK